VEHRIGSRNRIPVLVIAALLCSVAGRAPAAETHVLDNGITAIVHTPEDIRANYLSQDKDGSVVVHPSAGRVELTSSGEGLHPFAPSEVVAALAAMRGLSAPVQVEVFILPAVPRETRGSFARRGSIFLSPGTAPVDAGTVAYVTTHEMGHVLTWAFVDGQPGRWDSYLALRGLDRSSFDPATPHADRPREILAEDIRFLFGGPLATVSRSIENGALVLPDRVPGLDFLLMEFFRGRGSRSDLARTTAFPNPCNPMTTIELILPDGLLADPAGTTLRIFDIRGALVRTLRGGRQANDRLAMVWDGTDDTGRGAASGRYFYLIEAGDLTGRGTVTLVR